MIFIFVRTLDFFEVVRYWSCTIMAKGQEGVSVLDVDSVHCTDIMRLYVLSIYYPKLNTYAMFSLVVGVS